MTKEARFTANVALRTSEILEKSAAEEGLDLSGLTDEQYDELVGTAAQQLAEQGEFNELAAEEGAAEGGAEEGQIEPEAVVKLASTEESLGRYAAHAAIDQYTQRMEELTKVASAPGAQTKILLSALARR